MLLFPDAVEEVDGLGLAEGVAAGVPDGVAPGVGEAEPEVAGVGVGDGVTGGGAIVGGTGSAWTADPALIALPTSATTMLIATMAATMTASRLTQ